MIVQKLDSSMRVKMNNNQLIVFDVQLTKTNHNLKITVLDTTNNKKLALILDSADSTNPEFDLLNAYVKDILIFDYVSIYGNSYFKTKSLTLQAPNTNETVILKGGV